MTATANPGLSNKSNNEALLAVFKVLSQVLAIRLFLLLAVIGAFILAYIAMSSPDAHTLWVLGIYCAFTVLPLVFWDLASRGRE
jgi:hypothetical protein